MTKARKFLFTFLAFSFGLHVLFFFAIRLEITPKQSPKIYAWTNIFPETGLKTPPKIEQLPKETAFFASRIQKSYFSNILPLSLSGYTKEKSITYQYPEIQPKTSRGERDNKLLYLWEKPAAPESGPKSINYRALVSPQGKAILLYPTKLSHNSDKNISSHNHLREAAYFVENNFFWTKVEVLIE